MLHACFCFPFKQGILTIPSEGTVMTFYYNMPLRLCVFITKYIASPVQDGLIHVVPCNMSTTISHPQHGATIAHKTIAVLFPSKSQPHSPTLAPQRVHADTHSNYRTNSVVSVMMQSAYANAIQSSRFRLSWIFRIALDWITKQPFLDPHTIDQSYFQLEWMFLVPLDWMV